MPNLTAAETQAIEARLVACYDMRRGSRFVERPATRTETDRLRRLLAAIAGTHPDEVRLVRGLLNDYREADEPILSVQVANAVRYLASL